MVNGNILTKNKQNNSINGIIVIGNKKCFYKVQEIKSYFMELQGYYQMYSKFPIPELVFAVVFNDCGVIIYKYEDSISPGKYSLQGTTQGNGLTGGVPPVRFSM